MRKRPSISRTLPAFAALFSFLAWPPVVFGQTFISAMAGYIHHIEGEVFLNDNRIEPKPSDFKHVLDGQSLRTGAGRAEIMLTPGSFLRLGKNSRIEMISAGLANVQLRLTEGSAVVDLRAIFEKDSIVVLEAGYEILFPKPGVYRLNAADPVPTLSVFRGRALVRSGDQERAIKGKQVAELAEDAAEVGKFNPNEKDALDEWSETRAESLVQVARSRPKGQEDGMDRLYREWLDMTLRRPSPQPPRQPQTPQPRSNPAPKR